MEPRDRTSPRVQVPFETLPDLWLLMSQRSGPSPGLQDGKNLHYLGSIQAPRDSICFISDPCHQASHMSFITTLKGKHCWHSLYLENSGALGNGVALKDQAGIQPQAFYISKPNMFREGKPSPNLEMRWHAQKRITEASGSACKHLTLARSGLFSSERQEHGKLYIDRNKGMAHTLRARNSEKGKFIQGQESFCWMTMSLAGLEGQSYLNKLECVRTSLLDNKTQDTREENTSRIQRRAEVMSCGLESIFQRKGIWMWVLPRTMHRVKFPPVSTFLGVALQSPQIIWSFCPEFLLPMR